MFKTTKNFLTFRVTGSLLNMENVITCTLLYFCVVALVFSQNKEKAKSQALPNLKQNNTTRTYSVMDISCIFENEENKETKEEKIPLKKLTIKELRKLAKKQNIRQSYKLSKAELVSTLENTDNVFSVLQ